MTLAIIIAFFSVIFLMIIHEFGHFLASKKSGLKFEEFGIGYPPRIWGRKFGETFYSLNLLPFGAFVKITGEIGKEAKDKHGAVSPVLGIEDYQSFSGLSMPKKVFIVLGGIISFWVAAIVIFTILFNLGVDLPVSDQDSLLLENAKIRILDVRPNSPAEISGIKKGDIIKEMGISDADKKEVSKIKDFQDFTEENKGKEVYFTIQRAGETLNISLIPRVLAPQGEGLLGVQLQRTITLVEKYPWYQTPLRAVAYCGEITVKTMKGLVQILSDLFTGKGVPEGAEPAGPIGITVYLARAVELGVGFFLYFIGAISVLLAIFNLFPIPALDGGKLLFLLIEKIKGEAVSPKIEGTITAVFFFLLIALSIFVTIKFDIPKLSQFINGSF